jgi:uncharacterized membrane protein YeaQ/YmgE (transglycosylase-associated protein family)
MGWIVALIVGGITGLIIAVVGALVLLGIINLIQRGRVR